LFAQQQTGRILFIMTTESMRRVMVASMDSVRRVTAAIRSAAPGELPDDIESTQSFVFDLGFDSLAIARLGLTLEEQFGFPMLLDAWLSSQPDPSLLTVGSLCVFVESRMDADERVAV
jgi:acyl carrier protein